jgi:DNA-binding SARP family transcriptional activator
MTISEIEQAITELSPEELVRFREWFEEYYAEVWDKQIEEDAKSGRLDKLISEADEEYNAGLSKPL